MHKNIYNTFLTRVEEFIRAQKQEIYPRSIPLRGIVSVTDDPVPFAQREDLPYHAVSEGDVWGKEWQSAWFHFTAEVPPEFAGKELCFRINTGGESLVFDEEGTPVYGLTWFSVMDHEYEKDRMVIGKKEAGETVSCWVEAAANGLFGINKPLPYEKDPVKPHGSFSPTVRYMQLCVFDREMWGFLHDIQALYSLLLVIPQEDYHAMQILHALTKALDIYNYDPANVPAARLYLKETIFSKGADPCALNVRCVGHAHIDVGWLWPVRESIRKAGRTFSSQIALMEKYPEYIFGASQAELYMMVKENYPGLYAKIKDRVKEGRWEVQGGMWVEADCNIISGESMARQFLMAKNFFMDEFGVDVKNLWIPDVFGYSAALPQIIKEAGCDYFLTQKLSWSQINEFPHHTFRWKGIDGTEVITHFPPESDYNAVSSPDRRYNAQNKFKENGFLPEFLSLYGIGDGGGGPSEDYVERNLRQKSLPCCPKVIFSRADTFFDRLSKYREELPVWKGELYLEMHRATLTTQGKTKWNNRRCEQMIPSLEYLCAMLPAAEYPAEMLRRSWRIVLRNQFHDIIPGSSIHMVYEDTEREHAAVLAETAAEMKKAAARLFTPSDDSCVAVNTLSYPWNGILELPDSWNGYAVLLNGENLPVQNVDGKACIRVEVPAQDVLVLRKGDAVSAVPRKSGSTVLENDLIRYEFSDTGRLIRAYDKQVQKEVLSAPANMLTLYNDRPRYYDAWDFEIYYRNEPFCTLEGTFVAAENGPVCQTLEFEYKTADSTFRQKVVLRHDSRRLDFVTHADWHEYRKLLRVAFPVNVVNDEAAFDIQYGYIKRTTHDNTSWDLAKFEVCGQRYADLSDAVYGAALLNDCKYGYSVKGSTLELSLLRAPKNPDFIADQCEHNFTYSFLPHTGDLIHSDVMQEAACLNRTPFLADGFTTAAPLPVPCRVDGDHVTLEVLKKAERDDTRIIRLVETAGLSSTAQLRLSSAVEQVTVTNLVEWKQGAELPIADNTVTLTLKPFEIRTLRLKMKD